MLVTDDEERELKGRLMQADIANKNADTEYKMGLLKYEPWKVVLAAFLSGAAFVGAIVGLLSLILHLAGKL
jgi:hypothetical protein